MLSLSKRHCEDSDAALTPASISSTPKAGNSKFRRSGSWADCCHNGHLSVLLSCQHSLNSQQFSSTYLDESNVLCVLSECLAAHIETVFTYDARLFPVTVDTAIAHLVSIFERKNVVAAAVPRDETSSVGDE